jgi:glycosyltransferase involved in cell wall biosynthesis
LRVLVDTTYLARGRTGTGVYLERLLESLRERDDLTVLEARGPRLRPGRSGARWNPLRSALNAALDLWWREVGLPREAQRTGVHLIHHPLPARSRRAPCAQAVTVHDVSFVRHPDRFHPLWRLYALRSHRAAVQAAAVVVCVSEASARDAVALLGARREQVVVARHGAGQRLPRLERRPEPGWFLYVGDDEPRKDLNTLLERYTEYRERTDEPLDLVLAGASAGRAIGAGLRGEPDPGTERLAMLLAGACALVHPSLHEGFGLTLAEAMAAGTPVVAVRNEGTEEVCGDAGRLVESRELADALLEMQGNRRLRDRLAALGRERAASLSWDDSAARHAHAYARALGDHAGEERPMRVAVLGTRGIPASYSGFETAVEQITSRLTARGHEVTVYCRPHVVDRQYRTWKGARLVHLPTIRNKYLDTFVHTLLSALHTAYRLRPDVALFFIAGNSPLCLITRARGIPTLINVDGLDSDRRKWNRVAKTYLRAAERLSPTMATRAITDSHAVAHIFEQRFGKRIGVVPYGAEAPPDTGTDTLDRLGLEPRRYILFVGRLEPENNPHVLVEAFARIPSAKTRGMKLVVVGGAPYASEYIERVRRAADPRVLFPGYIFGRGYWELQRNAYLFCAPTEVGGTHPVILEALAAGKPYELSRLAGRSG